MTPLATAAAPILQAAQLAAENGPALLAIDGRCGSGKSTLAQFLAGQLGCRVVHTDDFYLPIAARCANCITARLCPKKSFPAGWKRPSAAKGPAPG